MHIHFVSLFPDVLRSYFETSIMRRAQEAGVFTPIYHNLADYSIRPTRRVDRRPYGGFPGMILEPEPLATLLDELDTAAGKILPKIFLSPRGKLLTQEWLEVFANTLKECVFLCGHYEGIDERILEYYHVESVCIGEYVLSSWELAAMVLADGIVRLLPWVLSKESLEEESFSPGLDRKQEYPHYTRPEEWRWMKVPAELLSGDPKKINSWKQSFL